MTVASVKNEKKKLSRVTLDDGRELLLDTQFCLDNGVFKNCELDEARIEALKHGSDFARAKSRALWYLDSSDHTMRALRDKLTRAGFDREIAEAVVARLAETGIVNDRRFAEYYAGRCAENNISRRAAFYKLMEKGVTGDMAREVLDGMDTDEEAQIRALVAKKYAGKLDGGDGTKKVFAALIRRGFSFGAVKSVLKAYAEEIDYNEVI